MESDKNNQELSVDDVAALEMELRKAERDRLIVEKNISIKEDGGYFEAVSINASIDEWRRKNAAEYAKIRRKKREAEARKEGRELRTYEPATPERRREQLRASKQKARNDLAYAEAERAKNTSARAAARARLTDEEKAEINRIRREKYAGRKSGAQSE